MQKTRSFRHANPNDNTFAMLSFDVNYAAKNPIRTATKTLSMAHLFNDWWRGRALNSKNLIDWETGHWFLKHQEHVLLINNWILNNLFPSIGNGFSSPKKKKKVLTGGGIEPPFTTYWTHLSPLFFWKEPNSTVSSRTKPTQGHWFDTISWRRNLTKQS